MHEINRVLELEINKWKQKRRDKLLGKAKDTQFVLK